MRDRDPELLPGHPLPVSRSWPRYYEPFLGSLQRSDDALHTSLALATAALVVPVAALIQAIGVFRTGIFRWVLIVTFVVLGLPIVIVLNVLKDFQAPNCF